MLTLQISLACVTFRRGSAALIGPCDAQRRTVKEVATNYRLATGGVVPHFHGNRFLFLFKKNKKTILAMLIFRDSFKD